MYFLFTGPRNNQVIGRTALNYNDAIFVKTRIFRLEKKLKSN